MLKITQTPYKIGITGTISSGKSWVGTVLKEAGVPVLDTDDVVHQLYRHDSGLRDELQRNFGDQVIDPEGNINRPALRDIVFNDKQKLDLLEKIVHPRVTEKVKAFFDDKQLLSPLRVVLVPKLFESKTEHLYNEVWTVVVKPPSELVNRLMKRAGISREEAENRLAAQLSQEEKAARSHRIIDNSGSKEDTKALVLRVLQEIEGALPA